MGKQYILLLRIMFKQQSSLFCMVYRHKNIPWDVRRTLEKPDISKAWCIPLVICKIFGAFSLRAVWAYYNGKRIENTFSIDQLN